MGNACDVIPLKRYFFRCGKSGEMGKWGMRKTEIVFMATLLPKITNR